MAGPWGGGRVGQRMSDGNASHAVNLGAQAAGGTWLGAAAQGAGRTAGTGPGMLYGLRISIEVQVRFRSWRATGERER
jgi:hypothetical protein